MIKNRDLRRGNTEQQVHYFGKWPFTRVFGMQEVFSSFFSLLNGVPFIIFLFRNANFAGCSIITLWLFRAYCLININTWVQSAVFHARESPLTETLDYFCTNMKVANSLGWALFHNILITRHASILTAVVAYMLPVMSWLTVVWYLTFVDFDYGLFMKFTVAVGICVSCSWLVWTIRVRSRCR